jgi:hypothetical protein
MRNPRRTLHVERLHGSRVLTKYRHVEDSESPTNASEPSPPSHRKASIRHSERIDPHLLGNGAALLDEEPGRNVAPSLDCAITPARQSPNCCE